MAKFSVFGSKGAASVTGIIGARADATTPQRGKLYDYMVACIATPADNVFTHLIQRSSTAGTGAAVTPSPLDPADAAALMDGIDTITVNPTTGVTLLQVGLNQRATYRWVAAPGSELVFPATASNGLLGALGAASTSDFDATMLLEAS